MASEMPWPQTALVVSCLWSAIVAYLIFHAISQHRLFHSIGAVCRWRAERLPSIAVVIPMRNERHNVGGCLESLRNQNYPRDKLRLIVVDDGSTDGTAEIVRAMAREM